MCTHVISDFFFLSSLFADYFSPWVQLAPRHVDERNYRLDLKNGLHVAVRDTVFLSSCRCSLDFVPTPPFLGLQRTSQPPACIPRTTTSDNANYQSWFGATAKRAKHEAPRHRHFQLGGQFRSLVRTLCVCQGIQCVEMGGVP
jgi:hypothetical protein